MGEEIYSEICHLKASFARKDNKLRIIIEDDSLLIPGFFDDI